MYQVPNSRKFGEFLHVYKNQLVQLSNQLLFFHNFLSIEIFYWRKYVEIFWMEEVFWNFFEWRRHFENIFEWRKYFEILNGNQKVQLSKQLLLLHTNFFLLLIFWMD